jgi:hypothetical protein
MTRVMTKGLRLASVPVGVGVGFWTASLWVDTANEVCGRLLLCAPGPRFALWQCALFGAGAAVVLLLLSLATSLTDVFRLASLPVGVGVALWTAFLTTGSSCPAPPPGVFSGCREYFPAPTFAVWLCALFGAGAAVIVLLVPVATARLPSRAEASSSARSK